ncbi:MAG: hypothetical protein AAFY69_13715 [Pseudomonadota bacterium]
MKRFCMAALAALALSQAHAEGTIGGKVGTLGLGLEGSYQFTDKWAVRGGFNQFDYDFEDDLDGVDFDGDLELSSITLLADYRPTSGGFRLTGGAVFNENAIVAVADPTATYEIDDTIYTIEETGVLSADSDFDSVAPYLGLGYDWDVGERLLINFDLGVLFQGEATVQFASVGGTLSTDPDFLADLEAEERIAEDDLEDYDLYPVLSIGLSYSF